VSPYAVTVSKEYGIDIAAQRAKSVTNFRGKSFDYVITICDRAKGTFVPSGLEAAAHRGFEDPAHV
jgi:arsenate reductase